MADPTVDDRGQVMLRPPRDDAATQDQIDRQDADLQACTDHVGLEPRSTANQD